MKKFYDVDVLTTKAINYMSWKNEYPHNAEYVNGVLVKRFGVEHEWNID